ncbi:hypothetical protein KCU65_g5692, partial [Aureobasidium melanogenum]
MDLPPRARPFLLSSLPAPASRRPLLKDGPAFSTDADSNVAETRFTELTELVESCVYAAKDTPSCFALYCRFDDLRAAAVSKARFERALTTVSFNFVDHHEYFGHDHTNPRAQAVSTYDGQVEFTATPKSMVDFNIGAEHPYSLMILPHVYLHKPRYDFYSIWVMDSVKPALENTIMPFIASSGAAPVQVADETDKVHKGEAEVELDPGPGIACSTASNAGNSHLVDSNSMAVSSFCFTVANFCFTDANFLLIDASFNDEDLTFSPCQSEFSFTSGRVVGMPPVRRSVTKRVSKMSQYSAAAHSSNDQSQQVSMVLWAEATALLRKTPSR